MSSPLGLTYLASQNRNNLTWTLEEHLSDFKSKRKFLELAISQKINVCLLFKQIDKMVARGRMLAYLYS